MLVCKIKISGKDEVDGKNLNSDRQSIECANKSDQTIKTNRFHVVSIVNPTTIFLGDYALYAKLLSVAEEKAIIFSND